MQYITPTTIRFTLQISYTHNINSTIHENDYFDVLLYTKWMKASKDQSKSMCLLAIVSLSTLEDFLHFTELGPIAFLALLLQI